MTVTTKLLGAVAGTAIALAVAATSAQAVPITGSVELAGGGDFNGLTVLTATGLDFGSNGALNGDVVAVSVSGSFVGLVTPFVTIGSLADLTFGGGCTGCAATPTAEPFLTIGGFTLSATSLIVESRDAGTRTLVISGTGTLGGNGYDDTAGDFTLSTSSAINNPDFLFSYSAAASAAAPVPEPASLLLLGSGLLAAGFAARRRKPSKA